MVRNANVKLKKNAIIISLEKGIFSFLISNNFNEVAATITGIDKKSENFVDDCLL